MLLRLLSHFFILTMLLSIAPSIHAQQVTGTAVVLRGANLRAGPGTSFDIVGGARLGDTLEVVGCNTNCTWYELSDGKWIAAFLVDLVTAQPQPDNGPITVMTWNTELNDADIDVIGDRIAAFQDVDVWGLTEINRTGYQAVLEAAAEVGENADYRSILSESGGGDRMLAIYDATRFDLVDSWEENSINTTGNARAALVLHLNERATDTRFLFVVNHLYRSREEERHKQAELLNAWAARQVLPIIAVGDYNFDWDVFGGGNDAGYDLMTASERYTWVRPDTLVTTQCSGWPCRYNSVLDFVFTAGDAQAWRAESEIVVVPGDFPDDASTSDHRPVLARFWPDEQQPTVAPTPTTVAPVISGPTANRNANLRGGPGTNFAVAGSVQQGQALGITGRNEVGSWYELDNGVWIAAFLVDDAPATLEVIEEPTVIATFTPISSPTAVSLPPTATPVPAPSGSANVIIQTIFYDGYVSRVESDEYAVIANTGTAAINIGGWRLNAGDPGQDFIFPSVELGPGQSVRVYTNEIHSESGGFSFRSGRAIWNNKGDCGVLFDAGGSVVSERCY